MQSWTNFETSMPPVHGLSVPGSAEELSPAWLTACLQHATAIGPQTRVTSLETVRIGEGHGFAGRIARIRLHYEPDEVGAPATVIGKFASEHAPTREMLTSFNGYIREVRFYRELATRAGLGTPRCYLSH